MKKADCVPGMLVTDVVGLQNGSKTIELFEVAKTADYKEVYGLPITRGGRSAFKLDLKTIRPYWLRVGDELYAEFTKQIRVGSFRYDLKEKTLLMRDATKSGTETNQVLLLASFAKFKNVWTRKNTFQGRS